MQLSLTSCLWTLWTPPFCFLLTGAVRRKWINVLDEVTSDLLSHMDDCFLFIQEAVDGGGAALVHCQAGRSRSATILTAYLMKKYQLGFTDAYNRLKSAKQDVQVNSGFEEQLCLYEAMKCEVDTSSPLYKQYRLTKITEKYPELQHVPRELVCRGPLPTPAPQNRHIAAGSADELCSVAPVFSVTQLEKEHKPLVTRSPVTLQETSSVHLTSLNQCSG